MCYAYLLFGCLYSAVCFLNVAFALNDSWVIGYVYWCLFCLGYCCCLVCYIDLWLTAMRFGLVWCINSGMRSMYL